MGTYALKLLEDCCCSLLDTNFRVPTSSILLPDVTTVEAIEEGSICGKKWIN